MGRALLIGLFLVLTVVVPFLLWADQLELLLSRDSLRQALQDSMATAWLVGIALLAVDIVLPIPSAVVIGALGIVYGTAIGGLVASIGLLVNGLLGYWICRALGRGVALRLVGAGSLAAGERLFGRHGGWIVALSRPVPVGAEVVALSAGLAAMPARRYLAALGCGSLPVGFVYAGIGEAGSDDPVSVALVCLAVSAVLWIAVTVAFRSLMATGSGTPVEAPGRDPAADQS